MNIEGITVLNETVEEVVIDNGFHMNNLSLLLFCLACIVFIGGCVLVNRALKGDSVVNLILSVTITIFVTFCFAFGGDIAGHDIHKYELTNYYTTIEDTVPFKDVVNNYDLISQEGDLFILRDKIPNE